MVDNTNHDEMIAPYAMVVYKKRGDIQCQSCYVTKNRKLLVLEFKLFHSRYVSLRLLIMTVGKCILVNTKISTQKRVITTVNRKTVIKWVLQKVYFVVAREEPINKG